MNPEVTIGIPLIVNSLLLGVGLAMDAFSVSIANGLEEPSMKKMRVCGIAGIYALLPNCLRPFSLLSLGSRLSSWPL